MKRVAVLGILVLFSSVIFAVSSAGRDEACDLVIASGAEGVDLDLSRTAQSVVDKILARREEAETTIKICGLPSPADVMDGTTEAGIAAVLFGVKLPREIVSKLRSQGVVVDDYYTENVPVRITEPPTELRLIFKPMERDGDRPGASCLMIKALKARPVNPGSPGGPESQ